MSLPSPYIPVWPYGLATLEASYQSIAWTTANQTKYVPLQFPEPATLSSITCFINSAVGNYALAFYDANLTQIANSGSVAVTAVGTKSLALASYVVTAGATYYGALSMSSTQAVIENHPTNIRDMIPIGCGVEAAFPPPANPSPTTPVAQNYPVFAFVLV